MLNDTPSDKASLARTPLSTPALGSPRLQAADEPDATTVLAVLRDLRTHQGIVLVDLDETLYLRNSTEDFIDSARPTLVGVVVLLGLRVLDVVKPWSLTGGEATRDVWRVALVMLLAPWTPVVWRQRVKELARDHVNRPLLDAVRERTGPTAVVTVGFAFVVEALVRAFGLASTRIIACRLSLGDRRRGKLAMAVDALGEAQVARSMVVTDSESDRPLLDRCARPSRIVWSEARYVRACSNVYVPGQYITWVKRPGERYIFRGILQEDFAFWVLASIGLARHPLAHVAGLGLLLFSFWTVYERGYVDNDLVAARFESDPKLSRAFHASPVATPPVAPWVWALVSGALGVAVLDLPGRPSAGHLAAWAGVLVATYLWFRAYNRCDKATRAWMYLPLQVARSVGFAAVVPVTTVGALALGAHALSRWFHYYAYRLGTGSWPKARTELMRLVFLVVLAWLVAIAQGARALMTWSALGIVVWSLFRARWEIREVFSTVGRINGPVSRR